MRGFSTFLVFVALISLANLPKYGSAEQTMKWAQVVTAMKRQYVKQTVYNATKNIAEFSPEDLTLVSIKPPARYGQTLVRIGQKYGGSSIFNRAIMFGGFKNGTCGEVWEYKVGMVNSNPGFKSADGTHTLFDAAGSFGDETYACSQTKLTNDYRHVCNTWKKHTPTIKKSNCVNNPGSRKLFSVKIAPFCLGINSTSYFSGIDSGSFLLTQECTSAYKQRVYLEELNAAKCGITNETGGKCVKFRFKTKVTEWGVRTAGVCASGGGNQTVPSPILNVLDCNDTLVSQRFIVKKLGFGGNHLVSAASGLCITVKGQADPSVRGIITLQTHAIASLEPCSNSMYQSFEILALGMECTKDAVPYTSDQESLARLSHTSSLAANSLYPSGAHGAKMLVFGGANDKKGAKNDLWEYDIERKIWTEIFDGYDWTQTEDTHLHSKNIVYEHLKANVQATVSSQDRPRKDVHFEENPRPNPRMGHTATMVHHKSVSTVVKKIPIHVKRSFSNFSAPGSILQTKRVVYDIGTSIFKADSVTARGAIQATITEARKREATMWVGAIANGWDGFSYPFNYTYTVDGSNIMNWTITLVSNTTLRLRRPVVKKRTINSLYQNDNFSKADLQLDYEYYETHTYTCMNMTHTCRTKSEAVCATCGGAKFTVWNPSGEQYDVEEIKLQTVTASATTEGLTRMLIFGGWVRHGKQSYISSEVWAFDYAAQLSMSSQYDANVYDTLYHIFPCCGTIQECCGTSSDPTFDRCRLRRGVDVNVSACVGSLPTINLWQLVETHSAGNGKPLGRYGHVAVNVGGTSSLFPSRDRLIVFGGEGGHGLLDDVWELSLDASPTDIYELDFALQCNLKGGVLAFKLSQLLGGATNAKVSHLSSLLKFNDTIEDVVSALSIIHKNVQFGYTSAPKANGTMLCDSSKPQHSFKFTTSIAFLQSLDAANFNNIMDVVYYYQNGTVKQVDTNSSGRATIIPQTTFVPVSKKYTWYKTDVGIDHNSLPSRRRDHAAAVAVKGNKEVVFVYGGWDVARILDDLWYYTPSSNVGQTGSWTVVKATTGRYLACVPNFFREFVDFFGETCRSMEVSTNPARSGHSLVALTSDFNSDMSQRNQTIPHESIFSYGGYSEKGVPEGLNWDRYGWPGGGVETDFFAMCHDDRTSFCNEPIYLR